jgi:predicted SprT family Zn-dependent metalloprotease
MDAIAALNLAYGQLRKYTEKYPHLASWHFELDRRSTVRFGLCQYATKIIKLSRQLVELNEEKEVLDTITHELAHAIVGPGHAHNWRWSMQHRSMGGNGKARYSPKDVAMPERVKASAYWIGVCGKGCEATRTKRFNPAGRKFRCRQHSLPISWFPAEEYRKARG